MSALPAEDPGPIPVPVDELLDAIADYADQLLVSKEIEQRDSMTTAAVLDELYESKVWVEEWLEHSPPPKRANRFDPESPNRFAAWQAWKQEQRGRRYLHSTYIYQLRKARRTLAHIPNFRTAEIRTEHAIRPLNWLMRNGYPNAVGEVWEMAVEAAGSPSAVTSAHTREALGCWKRDVLGKRGVRNAIKTSQAERAANKAIADVRALISLARQSEDAQKELVRFLTQLKELVDEAAGEE